MAGGRGQSASGRPLCAIGAAPARLTPRGRASSGHTLGPAALPPGRFPRAGGRRCAGAAARPQAPASAAVARKCRRAGSRRLKPTCTAERRRLTAEPGRAAERAPPRGRDFDFKERKEGRTTPSFPSRSGGRPGHAQKGGSAGPAEGTFLASRRRGACTLSLLRPVHRFMVPARPPGDRTPQSLPTPRRAHCVPPAPPPPRALRPRRWMA